MFWQIFTIYKYLSVNMAAESLLVQKVISWFEYVIVGTGGIKKSGKK